MKAKNNPRSSQPSSLPIKILAIPCLIFLWPIPLSLYVFDRMYRDGIVDLSYTSLAIMIATGLAWGWIFVLLWGIAQYFQWM